MVIFLKFKHIKFDDTRILWAVGGVVWEKKVGGVILDVIGGGEWAPTPPRPVRRRYYYINISRALFCI